MTKRWGRAKILEHSGEECGEETGTDEICPEPMKIQKNLKKGLDKWRTVC